MGKQALELEFLETAAQDSVPPLCSACQILLR